MTIRQMCDEVAAEFKRRGIVMRNLKTGLIVNSGEDVFNFDSHGELCHIADWWFGLFPERAAQFQRDHATDGVQWPTT